MFQPGFIPATISQDRHQIHHDPDRDKSFTEDKEVQLCFFYSILIADKKNDKVFYFIGSGRNVTVHNYQKEYAKEW